MTGRTDQTVTIKPEWYLQITENRSVGGGPDEIVSLYRQDNTKPPKTFVFIDCARGPGLPLVRCQGEHEVSDLRGGDHVSITCWRPREGIDLCTALWIERRYGGQVPFAIGDEKLPVDKRAATWRNAVQQREERAVQMLSRTLLRLRP